MQLYHLAPSNWERSVRVGHILVGPKPLCISLVCRFHTNHSSINDLRQVTDENLASVMTEMGYDESFLVGDIKLALGYLTVLIAGGLFYLDKKMSFKDSFGLTVAAVVAYFAISAVMLVLNRKTKNVKYMGSKQKQKIQIAGWTEKYDPAYNITITVDGEVVASEKFPFGKFFDSTGYYNRDAFAKLLTAALDKKKI